MSEITPRLILTLFAEQDSHKDYKGEPWNPMHYRRGKRDTTENAGLPAQPSLAKSCSPPEREDGSAAKDGQTSERTISEEEHLDGEGAQLVPWPQLHPLFEPHPTSQVLLFAITASQRSAYNCVGK